MRLISVAARVLSWLLISLAWCQSPKASSTSMGAFTQCAQGCAQPNLIPITGHVFDASTGKPIPNAEVHFFERNVPEDMHGNSLHQPHEGIVRSTHDGSYALPSDLPLSSYHVRASAPGFFAASYTDGPAIVGHQWPAGFTPRPSHNFRLQPNGGMVAIGSSMLGGAYPHGMRIGTVTAGAFASDRSSFLFALQGPSLWLLSLPDGKVRSIPLTAALSNTTLVISSIGWDGQQFLFLAADSDGSRRVLGEAAAPDFHITLVPTPNHLNTGITIGLASFMPARFQIEETNSCDEDDPSPHCGQSGSLVAHDQLKNTTVTLKSGASSDLSFLLDPISNAVLLSDPAPLTPSNRRQFPPPRERISVIDLPTGERSSLNLPGEGTEKLTLVAERIVPGRGNYSGYLTAYTTQGDCDPASTDAAQPFAPTGLAGTTPNDWSLCIITVPAPSQLQTRRRPGKLGGSLSR